MTAVASLYARLLAWAPKTRALSFPGRNLCVHSSSADLLAAACQSLTLGHCLPPPGAGSNDSCVVEIMSRSGFKLSPADTTHPRHYDHAAMGKFITYDLEDGAAVYQPGRGMVLVANTGPLILLVEDRLARKDQERWPNLTDLATVIVAEVLRRAGSFLAHAGAVGRSGHCLLFTGESGSGKTTATLRKAIEGWDFYGDDMVMIGRNATGAWQVQPLWRPLHLTAYTLQLLGPASNLHPKEFTPDNKAQCDITDMLSASRPLAGSVEAVVCLEPGSNTPTPCRLAPADALAFLGGTFLSGFNLRHASAELDNLLDFLTATPVYKASWATNPQDYDTLVDHATAHVDPR